MFKKYCVSDFFPDFFKLDLKCGSTDAHPLIKNLDYISKRISDRAIKRAHSISPHFWSNKEQQVMFNSLGIRTECLNEDEREKLFLNLGEISRYQGTLKSVELLAESYFEIKKIHRGYPYEKQENKINGGEQFILSDDNDVRKIIFIRLKVESDQNRIEEFKANSKLFLPMDFQVVVGQPELERKIDLQGFNLTKFVCVDERSI